MTKKTKVEIRVGPSEICVLIKGLPHLLLRRQDLSGIQTYYKSTGVRFPLYFIEFTTRHGTIIADYNERWLWEEILSGLRDARIFDHMLGTAGLPGSA
jgi:hypothetical protein